MPNLAAVLKTEIARLARRSTAPIYKPLKRDVAALKRALAQEKRLTARLAKDNARLIADLNTRIAAPPTVSEDEVKHARISPRLIKSQRARLGLSRHAFAKLVGVSGGAVLAWESGRSKPRAVAKAALVAIRKLGKRTARERLRVLVEANGTA
ncbi:MAG: helix-turn-helix domain-containing protein [Elusimicrobia bacterium]|nr:helix-turn-helix domain-containing protein [Elusimicrobiota bacterium]